VQVEEQSARADAAEGKLRVAEKSLQEHRERVARLEKEAAASKAQTVLQEVFALHPRLGSARRDLQKLRAHVEQVEADPKP
jgi:predicted  nucleic acid-binding Zn-ribbon protein